MNLTRKKVTLFGILIITLIGPLWVLLSGQIDFHADWRTAERKSAQIAPDPASHPEAIIQVYAARTFNWRGLFAVHTWIVTKRKDAAQFVVYQVIGWRLYKGLPPLDIDTDIPDRYWFGQKPEVIYDLHGEKAEALIPKINIAANKYPYSKRYTFWPGPNSNTFPAYIARQVPELGLNLPPIAIGKDFLPNGAFFSRTPSGTGFQFSLLGLIGITIGWQEGIAVNVLGLNYGISFYPLGIILPGVGLLSIL